MSPFPIYNGVVDFSFPRVSGDEPPILDSTEVYSGFSPRERG